MSYMMEQSANLSKAQAHANTHSLYLFLTDTHTLSLPLQLALIFLTDRKWVEWMSQAHIPMTFSLSLLYCDLGKQMSTQTRSFIQTKTFCCSVLFLKFFLHIRKCRLSLPCLLSPFQILLSHFIFLYFTSPIVFLLFSSPVYLYLTTHAYKVFKYVYLL